MSLLILFLFFLLGQLRQKGKGLFPLRLRVALRDHATQRAAEMEIHVGPKAPSFQIGSG